MHHIELEVVFKVQSLDEYERSTEGNLGESKRESLEEEDEEL